MGYSLSWIAIKGRSDREIQQLLGFKNTGKFGNYGEHRIVGRELRNGWYILIANKCDDPTTKGKVLAKISKGCQAVVCSIEEHVMFSSCAFWKNGKKVWSVKHRGDEDAFDLVKTGKLPESYSLLKKELIEKQKSEGGEKADVDHIFDLPLELAKQYVGFKHDESTSDIADGTYEILDVGSLRKFSRIMAAWKPWLIVFIVLLIVGFILAATGELVRWIIKFVMGFVP